MDDLAPVSLLDVLLVDDDPGFRAVARASLRAWGFDVAGEAANGSEALDLAVRLRPSLVLLDIQLPDLDGFEVSRRLRAATPAVAVVLISTREAADYGRRIGESGVLGFITKSRLSGDALRAILPAAREDREWAPSFDGLD